MSSNVICWFSCGSTSAIATALALKKYKDNNIRIIYTDTGSEHEDNFRFLRDCERWYGREIEIHKNPKYKDTMDVYRKTRYLVGVAGARCTSEMKRVVRLAITSEEGWLDTQTIQVFGFDAGEQSRADKFRQNNPEVNLDPILLEYNLTKPNCLALLGRANIEIPVTYSMGFANANCLKSGCVKGSSGYWNHMRKVFGGMENPDSPFAKMAAMERELDVAICKTEPVDAKTGKRQRIRVFLDELDPEAGRHEPVVAACGIACGMSGEILDIPEDEVEGVSSEEIDEVFSWLNG